MTAFDRLPGRDQRVVAALLATHTRDDAALLLRISTRTLRRRLVSCPGILAAIEEHRDEQAREALARLRGLLGQTVAALESLLNSGHDGVRLGAIRTVLDGVLKLQEASELRDRIAALETRITAFNGGVGETRERTSTLRSRNAF